MTSTNPWILRILSGTMVLFIILVIYVSYASNEYPNNPEVVLKEHVVAWFNKDAKKSASYCDPKFATVNSIRAQVSGAMLELLEYNVDRIEKTEDESNITVSFIRKRVDRPHKEGTTKSLTVRYTLDKIDGKWKIVNATIVKSEELYYFSSNLMHK
jgi:hypothetical protein